MTEPDHHDAEAGEDDDHEKDIDLDNLDDASCERLIALAKERLQDRDFDTGLEYFSSAIDYWIQRFAQDHKGETEYEPEKDERLTPYYVAYGDALVYVLQEQQSDALATNEDEELHLLAWENLDLARHLLYSTLSRKDLGDAERKNAELQEAKVRTQLGHLLIEKDINEKAEFEFEQAFRMKSKHFGPRDRELAECHFNLGLSHELQLKFAKAVEHYAIAIECLGDSEQDKKLKIDFALKIADLRQESTETGQVDIDDLRALVRNAMHEYAKPLTTIDFSVPQEGQPIVNTDSNISSGSHKLQTRSRKRPAPAVDEPAAKKHAP